MKINLIGMILNNCGRRCFDGAIIDDAGKKLDAAHSLDYMILEYAKVRLGGESSTVTISREVVEPTSYPLPRCSKCDGLLHSGECKPHNAEVRGERGLLRESSREAATSTDGLERGGKGD